MSGTGIFFTSGLILYLAGAASAVVNWRRPGSARLAALSLALLGSAFEAVASCLALSGAAVFTWNVPMAIPAFSWAVRLDPLSAWFNLALAVLAFAVSLYSFGYLRPMEGTRHLGALGFFYNVLLLSLTLVFTASNAFFFLVAWEVMALSAFCLVSFEHEKPETSRAAMVFLIMSHAGTGLLLVALPAAGRLRRQPGFRELPSAGIAGFRRASRARSSCCSSSASA